MHNYKLGYLSIGALVFLDLFSKYFVQKYLDIGTSIELIPILDLVLVYNSGIAFSFFDFNNFFTTYGLLIIGIILIVYLHYIYRKDPLSQQNFSIAMILAGASITTLEAVVMGVPVIRLVPDNTFSYDSFAGADYLLEPVNTVAEIKKQLQIIDHLLVQDSDTFSTIAKRILPMYFSKPTDINLKHFL